VIMQFGAIMQSGAIKNSGHAWDVDLPTWK